jgi:hypothetical protein
MKVENYFSILMDFFLFFHGFFFLELQVFINNFLNRFFKSFSTKKLN